MTAKRNSGSSGVGRKRTTFEWALLLVSLAAALALVIGLVVSELSGPDGPADLASVTDAGDRRAAGGRWRSPSTNVGGTSAENVVVEVTVGDVVREVTLELVAKGDEESADVVVPRRRDGSATGRGAELHDAMREVSRHG